jgi:hypothetical protein
MFHQSLKEMTARTTSTHPSTTFRPIYFEPAPLHIRHLLVGESMSSILFFPRAGGHGGFAFRLGPQAVRVPTSALAVMGKPNGPSVS